jgi:hypothetical protein
VFTLLKSTLSPLNTTALAPSPVSPSGGARSALAPVVVAAQGSCSGKGEWRDQTGELAPSIKSLEPSWGMRWGGSMALQKPGSRMEGGRLGMVLGMGRRYTDPGCLGL